MRLEDHRLLTGNGRFVDDLKFPDLLHAHILRSTYAHARILSVDVSGAREMEGVVAVYTAADLDRDGIGPLPCRTPVTSRDGSPMQAPERPVLARDLPRLTERFYRVGSDRGRKTGGTGLGLSIVKHVMNAHQARLQIESELGEGSSFRCQFPPDRRLDPDVGL